MTDREIKSIVYEISDRYDMLMMENDFINILKEFKFIDEFNISINVNYYYLISIKISTNKLTYSQLKYFTDLFLKYNYRKFTVGIQVVFDVYTSKKDIKPRIKLSMSDT